MTLPAMQRGCHLVTSLIQREIGSSLQGIKARCLGTLVQWAGWCAEQPIRLLHGLT